jgi:hypothetical protein
MPLVRNRWSGEPLTSGQVIKMDEGRLKASKV